MTPDPKFAVPPGLSVTHPRTPGDEDWHGQAPNLAHSHVINEDWAPEKKNRAANHIDIWHSIRSA